MIKQIVDVRCSEGEEGTREIGRKYGRIKKMGGKKNRKKMGIMK
jgi:hypothetical protein